MRPFNDVQIISNDELRISAFNVMYDVSSFILLRKNEQEIGLLDTMVKTAREKVSVFQQITQLEVTKILQTRPPVHGQGINTTGQGAPSNSPQPHKRLK